MTVRPSPLAARSALRCALLAATLLAATPQWARSQNLQAGGSIGVSLTILQPVATRPVQLLAFSVDRSGIARIETSVPVTGPASQVVMTSVSSSTSDFVPVAQAPVLISGRQAERSGDAAATGQRVAADRASSPARLAYVVDIGRQERGVVGQRAIQLRIQHLTVAGT